VRLGPERDFLPELASSSVQLITRGASSEQAQIVGSTAYRWVEVATMDLLTTLEKVNNREGLTAAELMLVLKKDYAVWQRGDVTLTDYGRRVLSTLARAA
jgi:hypothetical protein